MTGTEQTLHSGARLNKCRIKRVSSDWHGCEPGQSLPIILSGLSVCGQMSPFCLGSESLEGFDCGTSVIKHLSRQSLLEQALHNRLVVDQLCGRRYIPSREVMARSQSSTLLGWQTRTE